MVYTLRVSHDYLASSSASGGIMHTLPTQTTYLCTLASSSAGAAWHCRRRTFIALIVYGYFPPLHCGRMCVCVCVLV